MSPRHDFYKTIFEYYFKVAGSKLPAGQLEKVCERIADYYYGQYTRFRKQYPKSAKRYSTFQINDLDHPQTFEIIINYFKQNTGDNYSDPTIILLGWTSDKLQEFERSRQDFYNMF